MTSLAIELLNIGTSFHYACEIQKENAFKAGLDLFKLSKPDSPNGFWKLSEEIFNRITDKSEHVNYLLANRDVALRQNILF